MENDEHDNSSANFWPSYVDLFTGLFVVMLILFVVSYFAFQKSEGSLKTKLAVYSQLDRLDSCLKTLDEDHEYFTFDSSTHNYILNTNILFDQNKYVIPDSSKPALIEAGRELRNFLDNMSEAFHDSLKLIVVIEGMAAYNEWTCPDRESQTVYQLTYNRALAFYNLLSMDSIKLFSNKEEDPLNSEKKYQILVSGSGFNGFGRKNGAYEDYNKKFIIHILPKISFDENRKPTFSH